MSAMRVLGAVCGLALLALGTRADAKPDAHGWRAEAARVTIIRDDHGIAHVHGRSDADAVFGLIYAQAEDDFPRIEANYLDNLGLRALARGEGEVWSDLRARLYNDPAVLKARYRRCPPWLKRLMGAWADGLNYYLATHPDTHPETITRFEPWMTLAFSEGSIGGDIESISLEGLQAFYGHLGEVKVAEMAPLPMDQRGSNGIAIAPQNTQNGHALLLINPHTSFYFRSEAQITSDAGLNAYGASTWGQFFIYQGFNAHAGWMHTTTGSVRTAEFKETIVRKRGALYYRYGAALRPVQVVRLSIPVRAADGSQTTRAFTVYRTHHGPIVRSDGGRWVSFAMMDRPVAALQQSWLRTRATDYESFRKVAGLKANSSNNTLFADDRGTIAYLHPQFVPKRGRAVDYLHPVEGADPATDWQGLHALDELPNLVNPSTGFVYNSNNWPYSAAGSASLKPSDFPNYMDRVGENPRGIHALRLLGGRKDFTLERLVVAAYDSYQPGFARMIPDLVAAWDAEPADGPLKSKLAEPVAALRAWDYRWGKDSVPMSLAQYWADTLWPEMSRRYSDDRNRITEKIGTVFSAHEQLMKLDAAVDRLTADFGTWRTPWGEINRFQRLTRNIAQSYRDDQPSVAVGFASSRFGSLAAFEAKPRAGTKRYYGDTGNSFVAAVEFGPRVRAVAVSAGGESGHVGDPHFADQAQRYADGALRPVYFYPDELKGHVERTYRPGQ